MSFYDFFFVVNRIGSEISHKISELKSTTENVSTNAWFIHFYELCNYLNLLQKEQATNSFNSYCFSLQGHVGHYTNKSTETGLDFFIIYLLRAI